MSLPLLPTFTGRDDDAAPNNGDAPAIEDNDTVEPRRSDDTGRTLHTNQSISSIRSGKSDMVR
jgi:hypothetical protein